MSRRALLGAAGAGLVATAAAQGLPVAATSWRALRMRAFPNLAGVGAADHVALTFDDGPDPESTPAFLETLDRLGWRATFFMLGSMARQAPQLAAEIAAAGHEIGVHGDEHHSELWRSPGLIDRDLARAHASVSEAAGVVVRWFRPPYGVLTAGGLRAARRAGLQPVLWTAWGRDWRAEATPDSVTADVTRGLGPGATVLLHDSDCTSAPGAWRSALGALPRLAEVFAARGLTVGPLGDHGLARGAA